MKKLILATLVGSLALTACSKPAEEATDAAVAAQEAANEAQVAAADGTVVTTVPVQTTTNN